MNTDINYINRDIEAKILKSFNKKMVLVLYGARQTGKTTLIKKIFIKNNHNFLYLNCEEQRIREKLVPDYLILKSLIGDNKNIIFDEAQRIKDPGLILKILIDNDPNLNLVASGSSSFDLASKLNEPLTGRHFEFQLYPLSISEISKETPASDLELTWKNTLLFGSYPKIFNQAGNIDKINYLSILTSDYLYKDLLSFNLVRDSQKIHELLEALALQLGNEVSYNEIGTKLGLDNKTIERYIDLLEKSFVIFRLRTLSRNPRNELGKKVKIYFYDLGVRNSILNNFSELRLRTDIGALFENYFITEKIKSYQLANRKPNIYFWRTYSQKEIDFIEEIDGKIRGYEIKWSESKKVNKNTKSEFFKSYPNATIETVTPSNFQKYLV